MCIACKREHFSSLLPTHPQEKPVWQLPLGVPTQIYVTKGKHLQHFSTLCNVAQHALFFSLMSHASTQTHLPIACYVLVTSFPSSVMYLSFLFNFARPQRKDTAEKTVKYHQVNHQSSVLLVQHSGKGHAATTSDTDRRRRRIFFKGNLESNRPTDGLLTFAPCNVNVSITASLRLRLRRWLVDPNCGTGSTGLFVEFADKSTRTGAWFWSESLQPVVLVRGMMTAFPKRDNG